jgi:hypothetical protein
MYFAGIQLPSIHQNQHKMDETRPFIDPLYLTLDQQKLSLALGQFFESDVPVFLLKGYAGTGKTYLIGKLVEKLREMKRNVVLMAPTGRAAQVLAQKTNCEAFTIHHEIYFGQSRLQRVRANEEEYDLFQLLYGVAENDHPADTVFIVDEASMVSNAFSENEMLTFGSGYLLNDLIKYLWPGGINADYKIIFTGDGAQLPPVDMGISPALNAAYLDAKLGLRSMEGELTEVVRQKEGGMILENATMLRRRIAAEAFGSLRLVTGGEVAEAHENELTDRFLKLAGPEKDKAIIIAHSNKMVYKYNMRIREKLFPGRNEPVAGDRLVVVHNNYYMGRLLLNGEIGTLISVSQQITRHKVTIRIKEKNKTDSSPQTVELRFREALIQFGNDEVMMISGMIIDNVLYSGERDLTYHENVALFVDFSMRWNNAGKKGDWEQSLQNDPYFNALRVKFGYALTCHKSQGGEWPNVMVDCRTFTGTNSEAYFRWLYTAITRARESLWLINMPAFEDTLRMKAIQPKEPEVITMGNEEDKTRPDRVDCHGFAARLYQKLLPALEAAAYTTDEVKYLNYSLQFILYREDKKALIRIFFNAKNQVTVIEAPDVVGLDPNDIKPLFAKLNNSYPQLKFKLKPPVGPDNPVVDDLLSFLTRFRNKIETAVKIKDILIGKIESKEYHEIYHFYRELDVAVIKFYYNKKKQLTRYQAVPNRCNGLETEVLSLIKAIEL